MLAFESCSGNHMERIQRKSPKRECVACSDMASSVQETYTSPAAIIRWNNVTSWRCPN